MKTTKRRNKKQNNVFKDNNLNPPKIGSISRGEINSSIYGHSENIDFSVNKNKLPIYDLLIPDINPQILPKSKSLLVHSSSSSSFSWFFKYFQDISPPISPLPLENTKPVSYFNSFYDKLKNWSISSLYQFGLSNRRPYEYYSLPYPLYNSKLIIKSFSCHPNLQKIAVALQDDSVHIYELQNEKWNECLVLSHQFQKNIYSLQWKPLSGIILAVSCSSGVLIWEGDWVTRYLSCPSISNICSISWSPFDPFIAVGCPHDSVIIWDISTSVPTRLHSLGPSSSHIVKWSPDGSFIFQASLNGTFTIWETMSWTKETWNIPNGFIVQTACWSPNGHYLAYSLDGKSTFYIIEFNYELPKIEGDFSRRIPLSSYCYVNNDEETRSCGRISQLKWNSTGDRFMVIFCSSKGDNSAIALFATILSPKLEFRPIGFLRVPQDCSNGIIADFCDNDNGSLVISAADGKISTMSLLYNHSDPQIRKRNLFT